jgi:hypothetical protein
MANLRWNGDAFRDSQDSSGATAGLVSRSGKLQQGYNHGSLTQGLVAYYPMDAGSGSTLEDKTELGNDGTLKPGSSGTTTTSGMWSSSAKIGDNCLSFDGTDSHVLLPELKLGKSFSISHWVNLRQDKDWNNSFGAESVISPISYSDGKIQTYIGDGSGWIASTSTGTDATSPGSWQLWTVTYDGSKLRFFLNGSLRDSVSVSVTVPSAKHYLGWRNGQGSNYALTGRIDDFRLYNQHLSTSEIQALYNLSSPSRVSPADTLQ